MNERIFMRIAVLQPYFFPYIGYFQLIHAVDNFVIMDEVQFNRSGWQNRNRILGANNTPIFITIPVCKSPRDTLIKNIQISSVTAWRDTILGSLQHYSKSQYFDVIKTLTKSVLSKNYTHLTDYCIASLNAVADYIGIDFKYTLMSDIDFNRDAAKEPGDWSLLIADQLGAKTYINMPRGYPIYNEDTFADKGINLQFLNPMLKSYKQRGTDFVSHLSVLDMLMTTSPEEAKEIISTSYTLVSKNEIMLQHKDL